LIAQQKVVKNSATIKTSQLRSLLSWDLIPA